MENWKYRVRRKLYSWISRLSEKLYAPPVVVHKPSL